MQEGSILLSQDFVFNSEDAIPCPADDFVCERISAKQFTPLSLSQGELLPTVLSLQPERVCSAVTVSLPGLDLYFFFNGESVLETFGDNVCS